MKFFGISLFVLMTVACGDDEPTATEDTGTNDSAVTQDAEASDTGTTADTGAADTGASDAADSSDTSEGAKADAAAACLADGECGTWAAALAGAPRDADGIGNCAIQLHQADCCGAVRAYGINHGARTTLCPAEATCVATYPASPGCTDSTITTDTEETTSDMNEVKLRWVEGTCETFVCTTAGCMDAPGIEGGCG